MKLWKKVLAAVTAGVLCLGSVGDLGCRTCWRAWRQYSPQVHM